MTQNKTNFIVALPVILTLSACNTVGGYRPVVDTYNDRNAYRINQDMAECQQLASQASGGVYKETAIGGGVGGLIGAAGGAALGAAFGSPGIGAAVGAAAGGIGGATKQGLQSDDHFKIAYNQCLRNRGHNVIN